LRSRKGAWIAVPAAALSRKQAKNRGFPEKCQEKPQKPVETRVLPLTNAAESRKVNGGRFFPSRINTGFHAG